MHNNLAPSIPGIGLALALGALLLVGTAALAWRRAAETWGTKADHETAMALMLASMVTAMMAGLWAGVLGHGGLLGALAKGDGPTGLYHATLLGVEVGVLAGLLTGAPAGLAPALEGATSGLMGGLMGAMLLAMIPEAGSALLALLLLIWAWAATGLARLLAPDYALRWLLLGATLLTALVVGVWGVP